MWRDDLCAFVFRTHDFNLLSSPSGVTAVAGIAWAISGSEGVSVVAPPLRRWQRQRGIPFQPTLISQKRRGSGVIVPVPVPALFFSDTYVYFSFNSELCFTLNVSWVFISGVSHCVFWLRGVLLFFVLVCFASCLSDWLPGCRRVKVKRSNG